MTMKLISDRESLRMAGLENDAENNKTRAREVLGAVLNVVGPTTAATIHYLAADLVAMAFTCVAEDVKLMPSVAANELRDITKYIFENAMNSYMDEAQKRRTPQELEEMLTDMQSDEAYDAGIRILKIDETNLN